MLLKLLMHFLGSPVLTPLAISAVTWLVNEYTLLLKVLPNTIARCLIVAVPPALAWIANQVGAAIGHPIDLSSINAAAGGLVATIIYAIGHAKGAKS